MPPIAPPKKARAARSDGSSGQATGASFSEETSSPSPSTRTLKRTPKPAALREKIVRFYMMVGTIIVPFSRFIPQLKPIGDNLKLFAEDAADAWVDLAEEDDRVKKFWESFVGASTWGNVIGVHFIIVMGAMPSESQKIAEAVMPEGVPDTPEDAMEMMKAMGADDIQIKQALKMAEGIVSDRPPEPNIGEKEHNEIERDMMQTEIRDLKNKLGSSMASPRQMGVKNDGQQQWSGPQNTGGIK